MQITTYDTESSEMCSIEVPIRRLAASVEPRDAIYWGKLLELVGYLHSLGDEHALWGHIILDNLYLSVPEPPNPARARAIKTFVEKWRQSNPGSETRTRDLHRAVSERFPSEEKTSVIVRVDWFDYVPFQGNIPELHYRFHIRHPGKVLTEDARAKNPLEAERVIRSAFGW